MQPDRIVVGSFDDGDGDRVAALYEGFDAPIVRTSVASAEMIKLASNAFLATRISFINEIANVSEARRRGRRRGRRGHGARPAASARATSGRASATAARCFPKDVPFLKLLAGNRGYHFQLLSAR